MPKTLKKSIMIMFIAIGITVIDVLYRIVMPGVVLWFSAIFILLGILAAFLLGFIYSFSYVLKNWKVEKILSL